MRSCDEKRPTGETDERTHGGQTGKDSTDRSRRADETGEKENEPQGAPKPRAAQHFQQTAGVSEPGGLP